MYRVAFKKKKRTAAVILLAVLFFVFKAYTPANSNVQMKESDTLETVVNPKRSEATCERNATAAAVKNFDSFPLSLKNYVYYQHCRNFQMLLDSPDKCGGPIKSEVFLLLVIKSSPGNFERREALRKTWAEETERNGVSVRRVFISGTTGEGLQKIKMNQRLKLEQEVHNDIIQWDFTESHHNLTLKQALFLEWLHRKCPNVSFVLNGDDDVLARPENIAKYLQSLHDEKGSRNLYAGFLMERFHPHRSTASKYYVPVEVFESNDYPPFCSGGGILMSRYTLSVLYKKSLVVPLFPLDDIYLAILLDKAGLTATHLSGMRTIAPDVDVVTVNPCIYKNDIVVHRYLPKQLYIMWNRIQDPHLKC